MNRETVVHKQPIEARKREVMVSRILSKFFSQAPSLGKPLLGACLFLGLATTSWSQEPPTLTLTAKLRDFISIGNPQGLTPTHPHFNSGCISPNPPGMARNMVLPKILVDAAGDTTLGDNRNPQVNPAVNVGSACLSSPANVSRFSEWYSDHTSNRKFKMDLTFTRDPNNGQYSYRNESFFPLDNIGPNNKFAVTDPNPFGDVLTPRQGITHNFGFTMELHTQFTYIKGAHQFFNFQGDDDVWVFVKDSLLIDLGGVHGAIRDDFDLDEVQGNGRTIAEMLGLEDQVSYPLDFFSAERQVEASNIIITTSIKLVQKPQPLTPPIATPASRTFTSDLTVSLTHPLITAGNDSVKIYYTLDGTTPSDTSRLYDKTKPLTLIGTTTLKAIAIHQNTKLYLPSPVLTEVYSKSFTASTLEILDANGLNFSVGYITEKATGYTIRLTTTQAGLTSANISATTKTASDAETIALINPTLVGGAWVYTGVVPFSVAAAILTNSKTESSLYDSLIVSWTNPRDPVDKPTTKLRVRAAPVQSQIVFSSDNNGVPTNQFAGTENKIFVFVTDQQLPPGMTSSATITTTGLRVDTIVVPLTYLGSGIYRGSVTTQIDGAAKGNDTLLQISVGDQLTVSYVDPLDKDQASAPAGFGTPAVIPGKLYFTDNAGANLTANTDYSPSAGKLFLRLVDDWAGGTVDSVVVTLSIVNRGGEAPPDSEVVILRRVNASKSGDQVNYEGSINLKDLPTPTKLNGTAETYWRGIVTAKTNGHDKNGAVEVTKSITATVSVAYPDAPSKLVIKSGDNDTATIDRKTTSLIIEVNDQSMSSVVDTIFATVTCSKSGDVVSNIRLIEVAPGKYQSGPLVKTEGPAAVDNILSCLSEDGIKGTYVDRLNPNDKSEVNIPITDLTAGLLYFTKSGTEERITAVVEEVDSGFNIYIKGKSPRITEVDDISVNLQVASGETEVFTAKETDVASGLFKVFVPFRFVLGTATTNQIIEGSLTQVTSNLRVNVSVTAITENNAVSGTITLVAGLVPPSSSYIRDINQDGKGDQVIVAFPKTLPRLPDTVTVHWNAATSTGVPVIGNKISFVPGTNNQVILLDMTANPYPDTLSGSGLNPFVQMPGTALFGSKTVGIDDSIPPTIVKVTKNPVDVKNISKDDPAFNVDTLIVVLSEPIKKLSVNESMLRFDLNCGGYASSKEFKAIETPTLSNDGKTLIVLVDNTVISPPVGSCIYLSREPSSQVQDIPGNVGVGSKKLEGNDGSKLINGLRGYPPVANLDPNQPSWQVAINDTRDTNDNIKGYATPSANGFDILWIPPVDLINILNGSPYIPEKVSSAGKDALEISQPQQYPYTSNNQGSYTISSSGSGGTSGSGRLPYPISSVQVVTTSKYIVDIAIFDQLGHFVRRQKQSFGYQGELGNRQRVVPGGYASYLVWDMKDSKGARVGQGVYIWKLTFNFEGNRQEVKFVRTGVTRAKDP
jgi:fibro-slime domain-containing protein